MPLRDQLTHEQTIAGTILRQLYRPRTAKERFENVRLFRIFNQWAPRSDGKVDKCIAIVYLYRNVALVWRVFHGIINQRVRDNRDRVRIRNNLEPTVTDWLKSNILLLRHALIYLSILGDEATETKTVAFTLFL